MDNQRPIYSFVARESERSPASTGRMFLVGFLGVGVVVLLAIVVSNVAQKNQSPSSALVASRPAPTAGSPRQPLSWYAPLIGSRQVPCPSGYRNNRGGGFERCVAIDIPGSSEWVRRVNTPGPWEIATIPGLQARGCGGEVYSLDHGGNRIDESCGYLDYRVTDGRPKTIIEGHNPLPR